MSIRARLLWLVTIAILAPAVLVGLRFVQDRASQIEAAQTTLATTAGALAQDLDEKIQGTAQLLYGLARARDLDTRDRAACSAFLSAVREEYPQFTGILTIDPNGALFCDSLRTGRNLDLRDRDYFRRAVTTPAGVVLEPTFGRLTGTSVLQIASPARNEGGELKLILLASLNLAKFTEDHRGLLRDGMEVLMLDTWGTVLTRAPNTEAAIAPGANIGESALFRWVAGGGTSAEIAGPDGIARVWSLARPLAAQDANLRILVGQPKQTLVADANQRLFQDMAILAAVAAILFGGVWVYAELGIRREISRIAAMATRLSRGDLGARIAGPLPGGELGGLMSVLNQTAESLQAQRTAIEDLNARLRQAQKMEAVGQLTGGLAHDFNNLLTVILGNAELLADRLHDNPGLRQMADMTRLAAERGAELTRSLLAFARRQPLEPRETDVGAHLRGIEVLLQRTLGEHVECRLEPGRDVAPALVDPAQLEAAILNLVLNARDAMPDGGRLTIETGMAHLDEAYAARNEEVTPGDYIVVAVTDTGKGMAPDVAAQAFEPFFTTKEFGKGSGLGLSMVYGFAKQSGGHVKLYSEPGQGTTVRLYLPRAPNVSKAAPPTPLAIAQGGNEAVLVVEDDEMVRAHVAAELTGLGYRVTAAVDGATALDVLRGSAPIDLLFTDVVMPGGLSGPQLAAEAGKLRPGIAVLYTSGYTENAVVHHGRLDPGIVLLSKPYRRQDLAVKVRAVLDARRTAPPFRA